MVDLGGFVHRSRKKGPRRYGGILVVLGRSREISAPRYDGLLEFLHLLREKRLRRYGGFLVVFGRKLGNFRTTVW